MMVRSSAKDVKEWGIDGPAANVRPVMWGMAQRRGSIAMMRRGPERGSP